MPNPSSDDVMSLFSLVERLNSIEKQEPKKGGIQQGLNGGRDRRGGDWQATTAIMPCYRPRSEHEGVHESNQKSSLSPFLLLFFSECPRFLLALAGVALRGPTYIASSEGQVSEGVHARDENRAIRRAVGRRSSVHL